MNPVVDVIDSPSYTHPHKAAELLKLGWRRCYFVVYDEETGEKIVTNLVYLPPLTNKEALERMLELWTK